MCYVTDIPVLFPLLAVYTSLLNTKSVSLFMLAYGCLRLDQLGCKWNEIGHSDVEEELLGVLDALLDLSEEENGLTTINDTMIVGEGDVHDGAGHDLASLDNGSHLGGVHAEDGTLRHVDDRGAHHRAENTSIGNGKGATRKVLKSDLSVTSLGSQFTETSLEFMEAEVLAVAKDGHDESSWCRHCSADVDEVAIDHIAVVDDGVDNRLLLEGLR